MTKLEALRALMSADDWRGALKLAASFPRLGDADVAVRRGWEAHVRPEFYRQLGFDVEQLKADGRKALEVRYGR